MDGRCEKVSHYIFLCGHTNGYESCHAELVTLKYFPQSEEKGLSEVVSSTGPAKKGVGEGP